MDDLKFKKYKSLIKWHINTQVKDVFSDSEEAKISMQKINKYKDFISQLELEISFKLLDEN